MIGIVTGAAICKAISVSSFAGCGKILFDMYKEKKSIMQEIAATSEAIALPESLTNQSDEQTKEETPTPKVNIRAKEESKEEWKPSKWDKAMVVVEDERVQQIIKGLIMQGFLCFTVAVIFNEVGILFDVPFSTSHSNMFKLMFVDSLAELGRVFVNIITHW